jgi:casein kinase 1
VVGGCYVLKQKLGQGSFGKVYVAEHFKTGEEVAVKLEKLSNGNHMLAMEARILRRLQGLTGIVMVHHSGVEGEYRAMVTDLLGPSLENVFSMCGRSFTLKTLLLLGQQMVRRLEDLHAVGIIHRDVKPDNFALGRGVQGNVVYLIDFGLAKQYYCPKAERHIPYTERKGLTGTAQYASINAHLGVEQSRRDDIQALGYSLAYLLRGNLPWQKLEVGPKQVVLRQILEMKQSTSAEALCEGYPSVLLDFLHYASRLHFLDKPDYAFLRRVLKSPFDNQLFDGWMDFCDPEQKVDESHDEPAGSEEIHAGLSSGSEEIVEPTRSRAIVSL